MPTRTLPRTDAERLQALEAAAAKAAVVDPADLAFDAATKTTLDTLLPQFRTEMQERGTAVGARVAATAILSAQRVTLKMYASHFFQNLNMGVARGVFQAADRTFYQLSASEESVPLMASEADLLMWTQRIVDGEAARVAAGGTAIPFPTSAEVGTERAAYVTLQGDQSTKRDAADSEQEDVEALRDAVDELILDIWDEVEFTFRKDSPSSLRAKAREYGVVYVSRPGEPSEPGQPPAAPLGFSALEGNPGEIDLSWSASEGATSYRAEKLEEGTDPDFVELATVTDTSTVMTGVLSGVTIRFRVIAINAEGESPPSDEASIALP